MKKRNQNQARQSGKTITIKLTHEMNVILSLLPGRTRQQEIKSLFESGKFDVMREMRKGNTDKSEALDQLSICRFLEPGKWELCSWVYEGNRFYAPRRLDCKFEPLTGRRYQTESEELNDVQAAA